MWDTVCLETIVNYLFCLARRSLYRNSEYEGCFSHFPGNSYLSKLIEQTIKVVIIFDSNQDRICTNSFSELMYSADI